MMDYHAPLRKSEKHYELTKRAYPTINIRIPTRIQVYNSTISFFSIM